MPQDIDGTLHLLDRSENDLSRALGDASGDAKDEESAPKSDKGEARDEPQRNATTLGEGSTAAESCGPACKALASMRRAAEHLCGLTGEADLRCDTARGRVARAEERVNRSCQC